MVRKFQGAKTTTNDLQEGIEPTASLEGTGACLAMGRAAQGEFAAAESVGGCAEPPQLDGQDSLAPSLV
jgi:hypothetical protein